MFIKVRNFENKLYNIKVNDNEKISTVKIRIGKIDGIDPERIRLMTGNNYRNPEKIRNLSELDPEQIGLRFGLRVLEDDRRISDYSDIKPDSTLNCFLRFQNIFHLRS